DLSKLEAGKMDLSIRYGDLSEFLQVISTSFDSLAEQRQITFIKNISIVEQPVGYDADKVEKIVSNILFNAFKFTPPGGQVAFSMHIYLQDHKIILSIADTGKGIPPDEQANIFSPFYQLKYDREDGQPGTGLGLSLVNELVKLYGGTIKLISELDKGTCMIVTLPLLEATGSEKDLLANEGVTFSSKSKIMAMEEDDQSEVLLESDRATVLIVEDNTDLRNFIASGFRDRFAVLTSVDGEEGLSMAMEHLPDIIISDIMMPRMNGLVFTNNIKHNERTSHIPVILLTAKADSLSRMEGLKEGADDYLAKPFSMEELQVRVTNLMDQRKRLAAKFREEFNQPRQEPEIHEPSIDEKFMMKVRSVIEDNIGNSHFSVEVLAAEMNLSRAQLFRKVKALINTSPSEFINDLRLQRAAKLLLARTDNVAQIGYAVGFNEQSYFAKRFRKKYGVSPSEYAQ
ncbi:MAG: hybrid sensor histidine kinase/response regulator, partial [Marivirga sp.]|nr:hybrid sensor histidine kinase/response regulator [Marivirga sp.]